MYGLLQFVQKDNHFCRWLLLLFIWSFVTCSGDRFCFFHRINSGFIFHVRPLKNILNMVDFKIFLNVLCWLNITQAVITVITITASKTEEYVDDAHWSSPFFPSYHCFILNLRKHFLLIFVFASSILFLFLRIIFVVYIMSGHRKSRW